MEEYFGLLYKIHTYMTSNILIKLYGVFSYNIWTIISSPLVHEIGLNVLFVTVRCYQWSDLILMLLFDIQYGTTFWRIQPLVEIACTKGQTDIIIFEQRAKAESPRNRTYSCTLEDSTKIKRKWVIFF